MCGALIPALVGVAALGLLGGGVGIGGSQNTYTVIPQEVGDVTHGIPVSSGYGYQQQYAYAAPQQAYAQPGYAQPAPAYAPQGPGYAASQGYYGGPPAPAYDAEPAGYGYPVDSTVSGSLGYNGQSAVGAGVDIDNSGVGVGANVGDVGVGVGARSY